MNNIHKLLWLAALPLAFTACQDEEFVDEQTTNKDVYTLYCTVNNGAKSRAQIQLGNTDVNEEIFYWNSYDQFTMYDFEEGNADYKTSIFTIDENYKEWEQQSNAANFSTDKHGDEGRRFTAIYPIPNAYEETTDSNVSIELQPIVPDDQHWSGYMRDNLFMIATGTAAKDSTQLTFNHLTATARITYTNITQTAQSISFVQLQADETYFGKTANINIQDGGMTITSSGNECDITLDNPVNIAPGESYDFYIIFFPANDFNENGTLTIQVGDAKTEEMNTSAILANNEGATGFEVGKRYWFNVALTDESLVWINNLPEEIVDNKPLFKAIEEAQGIQFTWKEDSTIDVNKNLVQINHVTNLDLSNKELTNLEGIQYFKQLRTLDCSWNELTELNLPENVNLEQLRCDNNQLNVLNVSSNSLLNHLDCENNPLTSIDVSQNPELTYLACNNDSISSLNLSNNSKLTYLNCGNTKITSLDLSANTELETLQCYRLSLGSLDLSNQTKLVSVECQRCSLTELNITNCPQLTHINCWGNQISELDLNACPLLEFLSCFNNSLTALNTSYNTELTDLFCSSNQLTALDLNKNTKLELIQCVNNQLTELDITATALAPYKGEGYEIPIECGFQTDAEGNNTTLTLYLTSSQKEIWDTEGVSSSASNDFVTAVVKE